MKDIFEKKLQLKDRLDIEFMLDSCFNLTNKSNLIDRL